jgi:hypothetical protein
MFTVTSGPKNSHNKWLLIMLLFMMNYDDVYMILLVLIYDHVGLTGA